MNRRPATALAVQALVLAFALAGTAFAADNSAVVGSWALELTYEGQPQKITVEIKTKDDGSLTGTWIGPHRTNELVDFGWDGKTLTFTRNVQREGKPAALETKATVEGDTMKGTITAPEGDTPFTAKRTKAT
jgi:hypothetical protein